MSAAVRRAAHAVMGPVILEQLVLKQVAGPVPLFIEVALYVPEPPAQVLCCIRNGPVDLHVEMGQGVSVPLSDGRILLNEKGVVHVQDVFDEIQESGLVEDSQVQVKFLMELEGGHVLHVFLDHTVFGKKTDVVLELGRKGAFMEENNERVEKLGFLLHAL